MLCIPTVNRAVHTSYLCPSCSFFNRLSRIHTILGGAIPGEVAVLWPCQKELDRQWGGKNARQPRDTSWTTTDNFPSKPFVFQHELIVKPWISINLTKSPQDKVMFLPEHIFWLLFLNSVADISAFWIEYSQNS